MAAPSPHLVSLLQNKLDTLIGKKSEYIENLSEPVKKRVNALKHYQQEHAKLEAKFQREILSVEKKYLELYKPLYEIRSKIICGDSEPSKEAIEAGTKIDEEEEKEEEEKEEKEGKEKNVKEEIEGKATIKEETETENKEIEDETEKKKTKDEGAKENEEEKGIPNFWLTAMKNIENIEDLITQDDEEALKYLIDIRMSYLEDKLGFKLEFEFDEENPFFTDKVLSKTYYYQEEPGYGGDFVYDRAEGEKIHWKPGKNLTVKIETKKQKHKSTKKSRIVKTAVPVDSFFKFFSPPVPPNKPGDDNDDELESELDSLLESDYLIGEELKDKLIPHAIDWYTGKALKYEGPFDYSDDDFDDEDYDDELDDDDDYDDDDNDDENIIRKNGKVEVPECKQQ